MNSFVPEKPSVVILVDGQGSVQAVGNNIDPGLFVNMTNLPSYFEGAIKGMPFDSRVPQTIPQVLAQKKK